MARASWRRNYGNWLSARMVDGLAVLNMNKDEGFEKRRGVNEMELLEGEEVVLDDGNVGYRLKLTLTNKRLIFSKKEGLFKTTWKVTDEIPLEQIEEAYTDTRKAGLGLSQLSSTMLKMKNGNVRELTFKLGDADTLGMLIGGSDIVVDGAVRTKTVSDRWVSAINQLLRLKAESRTDKLEQRIKELEEKLKEEKDGV